MLKKLMLAAAVAFAPSVAFADGIDPALYVVRDADSTMYLYGTIHVRPAGADWGSDEVRAAINASSEVWTEMDISPETEARTQQLAIQLGLAPAGRPLSSWLTAEQNARLQARAQQLGLPAQNLEPLKPWLAGLTLSVLPIIQAGFDPNSGVDRQLDAFAEQQGKTMRSFETVEQQLGFFANLSDEAQVQMLLDAIDGESASMEVFNQMSAGWEQGDTSVLERLIVTDMRSAYPELYAAIFTQRNNAWMTVIERELAGSGTDFIAVGAGHLVGEEGLVHQLRARGFTVERVDD